MAFSFFGGFNFHFGGSDHSHRRDTPKGADVVMDLDVTLEELYTGEFIEVCMYPCCSRTIIICQGYTNDEPILGDAI